MIEIDAVIDKLYNQFGEMEAYASVLIALMLVVWLLGHIANKKIAQTAFDRFFAPLESQFASPGALGKESSSHFFVYASGRSKCSGLMLSLHLSPRNDFLSRFVISWFAPSWYSKDRVVIEIFDPEIDPFISCFVCKKFQASSLTESIPELKKLCKPYNGALDGGPYSAFSSSSLTGFTYICNPGGKAIGQAVFGKSSVSVPVKFLASLKSCYVSGESKSLRIELDGVPSSTQDWREIIEYALDGLLESLSSIRLAASIRAEAEAQRNQENEKAQREAEFAKRNDEIQKQREAQIKNLSAAEREKLEEKRRKKEQKRNLRTGRIIL